MNVLQDQQRCSGIEKPHGKVSQDRILDLDAARATGAAAVGVLTTPRRDSSRRAGKRHPRREPMPELRRRADAGRACGEESRQPPAQYEHPASWARFKPHVPDGITVIPGTMLAAHSFVASSALTPALPASLLLWNCSA